MMILKIKVKSGALIEGGNSNSLHKDGALACKRFEQG